jgi:hypothetical protein
MASAQDFRDYADQCLEWAANAESDQERKVLRRMALTWWRIARLTEEGRSLENLADIFPAYPSERQLLPRPRSLANPSRRDANH